MLRHRVPYVYNQDMDKETRSRLDFIVAGKIPPRRIEGGSYG